MYSGSEPQTREPVQAAGNIPSPAGPWLSYRCLLALAAAALLSGCSSVPTVINPVTWWHDLQGGPIAEQRPPPPGSTDPYPNLATVPERPPPLDPAIRQAINQNLVADRANAQHEAASAPIPDLSASAASPGLPAAAPAPARAAVPANAKSPPPNAAASTPPTTTPEAPAGLSASFAAATAPLPAPAAPVPADAGNGVLGTQPEGSVAQMGVLPPLPGGPPPPANLPGASPAPPPAVKPVLPPPAGMPPPAGSLIVPFAPAATTLSAAGAAAVHAAAVQTNAATRIVITGYGDSATSDPATQATALTPAMLRAQAVARALAAEGIPASAIASDAQAEGRGAAVRLVN